ncbi:uncharacterized protein LOC108024597 [Drosophila biarmipes]|uniref:uncharacterized protein LOC108024597 n=1 Tax=Drosophila biarmipes TaxID=125945 RepID=UPI0007E6A968|nr:uncharacterized protein LOC108024597 [Drosophila biarmipes]
MADDPTEEAPPAPSAAPDEEAAAVDEAVALVTTTVVEEGAEIPGEGGDQAAAEEGAEGEGQTEVPNEDEMPKEELGSQMKPKGLITAEDRKREKLLKLKAMLAQRKEEEAQVVQAAPIPEKPEKHQKVQDKVPDQDGDQVDGDEAKEVSPRESVQTYQSLHYDGEESDEELADDEDLKAILNQKVPSPEDKDSVFEDDDLESVISEDTPLPRLGKSLKGEFIREFDSLPSISDISLTSEEEPEPEPEVVAEKKSLTIDTGHFVEGGTEGSGEGESESNSDRDASTAAITVAEAEEDEESVLMDDLPDELAPVEKQVGFGEEVDTMAMFAVAVDADTGPAEELSVPVEEPFWYRLTHDFLNNLINTVVAVVENADRNKEHLLDKGKMMVQLQSLVDEYNLEKYQNSLVNNIVCDYFRRIRKFNNFQALPPDDVRGELNRYMNALNVVDNLMERVKMIKIKYGHSTSRAMMELNSLSLLAFNEEQRLGSFMHKTLVRKDMDRLKRALDNDLRRMQDLRNQISEKRYELNLNLHNLAFVDEKVMKFERVTETLTISQMMCANESIIQLSKQLEEKCKDVAVMQMNYKKSMIEETCVREKRDMIAYMLSKAKNEYADRFERRNSLRKELTRLQLEHAKLKAKRAKLEAKGGLLFKTGLMYDYDKCMADIETRRTNIQAMKKTCFELSKRIYAVEHAKHESSISVRHLNL